MPSSMGADADALYEWREQLLIVNVSPSVGRFTVRHRGRGTVQLSESSDAVAEAVRSVADARQPVAIELPDDTIGRAVLALLPFGTSESSVDRIVIAIYPAS